MAKDLPLFELMIGDNPENGVSMVSLVDSPAIQVGWIAFSDQKEIKFETLDSEKRIIFGALLIPDQKIYRRDDAGNEFYVTFTKEAIYQTRERFMKNRYTNNTNAQHNENLLFDDIYMVETFISDSTKGVNPPEAFSKLPDGTWFGAFKVDNETIWNEYVKTGIFTGFSIEGNFTAKKVESNNKTTMKQSLKESLMGLIKTYFGENEPEEVALAEATLMDGTVIKAEPALEVGAAVMIVTSEGEVAAFDGTHELSDGTKVTTVGGLITEIEPKEAEMEAETSVAEQLEPMLAVIKEAFEARMAEITEKIETVINENQTFKAQFEAVSTENKDLKESLSSFIAELKEVSFEEPLEKTKQPATPETPKERAIRMAQIIQENKSTKN